MSKYQFKIDDINPDSTHGKILSKIKPGSKVLECGCASGYMTRYLHEKMGCTVDVIEINSADLEQAEQWANRAYHGNLDENGWTDFISGEKYDFILFADVLEHLKNPKYVMLYASKSLCDDGKIIVSIPNICHNDIMIRMYYDLFTYTNMGLLDNTHIHFWGLKDFCMMCDEIGLKAGECDCVSYPTGTTEQRVDLSVIDQEFLNCLKKRDLGEVYQFVFSCSRNMEKYVKDLKEEMYIPDYMKYDK